MALSKQKEKNKKIAGLFAMIITLVISVTGATYAYFTLSSITNTAVQGEAATADLDLNIERVIPDTEAWEAAEQVMLPQEEDELSTMMGEDNYCIADGNIRCQVYRVSIKNISTSNIELSGSISFTGIEEIPNLKWRVYGSTVELGNSDIVTGLSSATTNSVVDENKHMIENEFTLNKTNTDEDTKHFYIVLWINANTDGSGNSDYGTFGASVHFETTNGTGGVTSTFVS